MSFMQLIELNGHSGDIVYHLDDLNYCLVFVCFQFVLSGLVRISSY